MTYEQIRREWDARREAHEAATQPLHLAVLHVQTRVLPAPKRHTPTADAILRAAHARHVMQDVALPTCLLEPACMDRGS